MCDETLTPTKRITSLADVQAEQQKVLDQFIDELIHLHKDEGLSIRAIARAKNMNHETVRSLILSKGRARRVYKRN